MPHLLISAAHKSSGKTTATLGLAAALAARGRIVQPFKKGPDYIDPMWLGAAAGRACYNLDFNTMGAEEIRKAFALRGAGADIALVEGNKGLHDGTAQDGSNSNAALARMLDAPVILVLDTRGMTRGVAPLALGFAGFDLQVRVGGVILNHVGGSRHEGKLRAALEQHTDIPVLGALQRDPALAITERHLGLVPSNEAADVQALIRRIAAAVAAQVDLDAVQALAAQAPAPPAPPSQPAPPAPDLRIAIARDEAFGFYYADDLQAFAAAGAELVPFSPLHDARLPQAHALLIGGGFPETHLQALQANTAMRAAVREAIEAGLPAYAECGGLMYLARSIQWGDQAHEMAGVIPGRVVMHDRPQGRGYVRLEPTGAGPWPAGAGAGPIRAHEFHYSRIEGLPAGARFAYKVLRGTGIDGAHDGLVHRNLLASYTHLRSAQASPWVERFVAFVRRRREAGQRVA